MSYRELILSRLRIPADGSLVLAFSGGSDSLALLSLLPADRTRAVYVNHNIRDEKELEREMVLNSRNAERFSIPFDVLTVPRGEVERIAAERKIGIEAAARSVRYSLLLSLGSSYVLTAHHQDDQVETFLMRIASSAPVYALECIRYEDGRIVRPLLDVPKKWITGYLDEEGLEYSFDSTNDDLSYERNRIRHKVLPCLSQGEKDIVGEICRNSGILRRSRPELPWTGNGCGASFFLADYLSSPPWCREKVLYDINRYFGFTKRLSRNETGRIDGFLSEGMSSRLDSARFIIFKKAGTVRVFPPLFCFATRFLASGTAIPGFEVSAGKDGNPLQLCIDFSCTKGDVVIRTDRMLDSILLKEGLKKVSDLKKEYGIPYCYVLEDGEGVFAVLSSFIGGRDRLARRFLGKKGLYVHVDAINGGKQFFSSTFSHNWVYSEQ